MGSFHRVLRDLGTSDPLAVRLVHVPAGAFGGPARARYLRAVPHDQVVAYCPATGRDVLVADIAAETQLVIAGAQTASLSDYEHQMLRPRPRKHA